MFRKWQFPIKRVENIVRKELLFSFFAMSTVSVNPFPHYDTFRWIWEGSLLKTLWEKEKLLVQAVSPFLTMFSNLSNTKIITFVTYHLLSANAFNLVWFKILLCGSWLMLLKLKIWHRITMFP